MDIYIYYKYHYTTITVLFGYVWKRGPPNLPVVLRGNMMIKHESGLGVTHYWRNQSICRFSKFIQHTHRDNAQQLSLGFHFLQVGFHLKKHVVEFPFPLMTSWKSQCPESEVTVVEIQFLSSRIFGNKYIGPGYESDSLWVCGCWTGLDLGTRQFSGAQLGFFDVTDFRTVLACSSWFQHDTRGVIDKFKEASNREPWGTTFQRVIFTYVVNFGQLDLRLLYIIYLGLSRKGYTVPHNGNYHRENDDKPLGCAHVWTLHTKNDALTSEIS